MLFNNAGDSLEALGTNGRAREIYPGPVEKNKTVGCLLWSYTLKERAMVRVAKPLKQSSPVLCVDSHREIGDELEGYRIDMLCAKPLKGADVEIKPGSADHQAQFFRTKKYTFAELVFAH